MSIKEKVLVTTAAGKTGKTTALALLEKGYRVRAFVRQRDRRSRELEDAGAEIFVGNLADIADVKSALANTQRAYLCPAPNAHALQNLMTFAVAASESPLESIVFMGQWLSAIEHPAMLTQDTYLAEQILRQIPDINFTTVNPGWFADNYFNVMEPMAQLGIMPLPLGQGENAPPSNEDMGRVIAAILADPEPHHGKTYRPTGPELLAPDQIASSVGKALGRNVKYMNISEKMFLKAMESQKFYQLFITHFRYYMKDYRENSFALGSPNHVVEELTGRPAEDFVTIARRYADEMPEAKRTFTNKLRGMKNFAKILVTKTPDIEAIERAWELPRISSGRMAGQNPAWLRTHNSDNAYGITGEESSTSVNISSTAFLKPQTNS
jgi:uncharacterized protein YbjT (DUF2867 family)